MEKNVKVPFWKKTWFIVLACIFIPPAGIALLWIGQKGNLILRIILTVLIGFYSLPWLSGFFVGRNNVTINNQTVTNTETVTEDNNAAEEKAAADKAAAEASKPQLTLAQKNALSKAKSYLSFSAFSYPGLIRQLEFEGFSTEDSTFAADNCGADWNEQAAKKAKNYMDMTAFSRDGLIRQLEFEGFTSEQAEYGVTAVGY
ncbi:Ltp family lipoprotein [Acetobacterium wieringae]|uniref:Ltp family lipoprotein n=1 Tax=Acetobacterium wieringae TaxID=52694 RepID=A0ABY6HH12_9FIRM|nr:Ltp family lipoprotein [Acetobacterium wieringae]UYO62831.1 Ltp family lipoprotein [Acetobacterium wieringae]